MRRVIQLILFALIVALSYLIVIGIMKPIKFNEEKTNRYTAVVERLKDIRDAQMAYKTVTGKYTGDWDSLINLIKTDSFPVVIKIGQAPEHLTEKEALDSGYIKRDTMRVSMLDSLFTNKGKIIDSIKFVPFTAGETFDLAAKQLETGSKMIVPVFEAKVHNDVILNGMDDQERINLNADRKKLEKYPGLKVGSLEEASTTGNWETL